VGRDALGDVLVRVVGGEAIAVSCIVLVNLPRV